MLLLCLLCQIVQPDVDNDAVHKRGGVLQKNNICIHIGLFVEDCTGLNLQWCPLSSGCWQLFTPLAQSVWGSTYSGCRSPQIEAWKIGSQYLSCISRSNCMIFIFNATASTSWLPAPPCFLYTAGCSWASFQNLSMLLVMVRMMRVVMVKMMWTTKRMEWKDGKWQWRQMTMTANDNYGKWQWRQMRPFLCTFSPTRMIEFVS